MMVVVPAPPPHLPAFIAASPWLTVGMGEAALSSSPTHLYTCSSAVHVAAGVLVVAPTPPLPTYSTAAWETHTATTVPTLPLPPFSVY